MVAVAASARQQSAPMTQYDDCRLVVCPEWGKEGAGSW